MKRIIDHFNNKPWEDPIDVYWWYIDYPTNPIKFYCIIPHLINIYDDWSCIQNKKVKYSHIFLNSQKKLTNI